MPHDRHGQGLRPGDRVLIPAVVQSVQDNPNYCNLTVETEVPMLPSRTPCVYSLNSGQVEKLKEQTLPDAASGT